MTNDDIPPINPRGFTVYVEKKDFDTRNRKVDQIFYGEDGRGGLVGDMQILKTKITTAETIIKYAFGSSLVSTLIGIVTLLKLFNII